MPRHPRISPDGFVQHVLNRGDHRETLFYTIDDFIVFLSLIAEAACRVPMRILAYCVMRNHFHLLLWPYVGDDLPRFMHMLMVLHINRHRYRHPPESPGHIYQSRYTNVIVEHGRSIVSVAKYIEGNAMNAGLVRRAEVYPWSSASPLARHPDRPALSGWPIQKPHDWLTLLNLRTPASELKRIQRSAARGAPYGSPAWTARVVKEFGLEHTMRRQGRPSAEESILPAGDVATLI
jgi:REP-associated tyrosine transposase